MVWWGSCLRREEGRWREIGGVHFIREGFWEELLAIEAIHRKEEEEKGVRQKLVALRYIE